MQTEHKKTRTVKGVGQVRGESKRTSAQGKPLSKTVTPKDAYKSAKKSGVKPIKEERVNGAPIYTATYKVNRSDELMEFLLRKCNTSRNNVKSLDT